MRFDFRVFLGESYDGNRQTAGDLLHRMDELEIEMALACPFRPLSYDLMQANRLLAAAIRPHADRLLGAARIDPWNPAAQAGLQEAFGDLGLRALYLHPWEENFRADLERLDPLLAIAQAHQRPVLVASGFPWVSEALQVQKLARRWPDVPLVMSNGGQINISGLGQADATLAMKRSANVYIDTAGTYRQDFIEETAAAFGAERVLFGSGAPYFDQRYEIRRVHLAKVDEPAREAMFSGNSIRLLQI